MGIFDFFKGKSKEEQEREKILELFAQVQKAYNESPMGELDKSVQEAGSSFEGFGEFGYEPTNPIPVKGVLGAHGYFRNLRYKGNPITFERQGSVSVSNVKNPVDIYSIGMTPKTWTI